MADAAKRLNAEKKKWSNDEKNAELLVSHERENVLKIVGKQIFLFQKLLGQKNNMKLKQRDYLQRRQQSKEKQLQQYRQMPNQPWYTNLERDSVLRWNSPLLRKTQETTERNMKKQKRR